MKLLVAVKQVADLADEFEIAADGKDVDRDFCEYELNEWDDYALEEALLIREAAGEDGEVVVVTVGPTDSEEELRKCLGKGADRAIRVWDDAMRGCDAIAIARALAKVVEKEQPGLVLTGVQGADHAFASTGVALAACLRWPHAAVVCQLDHTPSGAQVRRELEDGLEEEISIVCPAVLTIQVGINRPRYATLRGIKQAAAKPLDVLTPEALGLSDAEIGEAGSASRVRRMFVPERGRPELIEGSAAEQALRLAEIIKEFQGDV